MADLTPRTLDWISEAPITVTARREMNVGASAAFAVIADHEKWPTWFVQVKKVEVTGAATGVGGRRRVTIPMNTIDEEFIAWEPDRLFAFTGLKATRSGVRSLVERVEVEPTGDDTCTVTYTQAVATGPLMAPLAKMARGTLRKQLGKALEKLEAAARG